jgi:hypothetical protein
VGDCALNLPVRVVQAVFQSIEFLDAPNFSNITTELQCIAVNSGTFAEQVVLFVLNTFEDFIDLIPLSMIGNPIVIDDMNSLAASGVVTGIPTDPEGYVNLMGTDTAAVNIFMAQLVISTQSFQAAYDFTPYPTINATEILDLLGFGILLNIASSPWSQVLTRPACAALALANTTLNWFQV